MCVFVFPQENGNEFHDWGADYYLAMKLFFPVDQETDVFWSIEEF